MDHLKPYKILAAVFVFVGLLLVMPASTAQASCSVSPNAACDCKCRCKNLFPSKLLSGQRRDCENACGTGTDVVNNTVGKTTGLVFRNRTAKRICIAVGYLNGIWKSSGWWCVNPGDSVKTFNRPLVNHYYYYYAATSDGSMVWKGDYAFCAPDRKFDDLSICGKQKGFREIYTGGSPFFSMSLSP